MVVGFRGGGMRAGGKVELRMVPSRFGRFNPRFRRNDSRLRLQKFPVEAATGIRSQAIDRKRGFGRKITLSRRISRIFPVEPGISLRTPCGFGFGGNVAARPASHSDRRSAPLA